MSKTTKVIRIGNDEYDFIEQYRRNMVLASHGMRVSHADAMREFLRSVAGNKITVTPKSELATGGTEMTAMTEIPNNPIMQMAWYNYRTNQYDYFEGAPSDFTDYVPQDPSAQALYRLYTENMGMAPIQAAKRTLLAWVGETEQEAQK